jgi:glycosyltransferase involved in cell wall biosynthesis
VRRPGGRCAGPDAPIVPPVRVAHIIPNGDVGGAQEYLASLAAQHAAAGLAPLIVTANRGPFVERYRRCAEVLVLPELNARVAPVQHLGALLALRRLLAARSIDIVHGHTSRGLVHASALRRLLRRPAVVSIHGFNSAHALMSPAGARLATVIKGAAAARVDALTVAAQAIREVVVRLGIAERKVHVVYAGIDTARFYPRPDRSPGPVRVGGAGRLLAIKGFRTYVEAACTLLDEGVAAEFELYGDGPEGPALRALVASRGHGSHFRFQAFHDDFPDVLRSWDIAVVPSVVDSFPFVPLEAMATGIPVIASGVGGIPEALHDGAEGLLVPPGDAASLAAALRRLLADAALRRRMGAAGVARVRGRFTWARAAHDYLDLYDRVRAPVAV